MTQLKLRQALLGGSRSRLGAQERQIAETRGLAEALAGIRGQGFTSARDASMGEFARQRGAEAGAASQTAGLGAQAGSAQAGLAQSLANLGQQRFNIGTGAGSQQAGLASQSAASQLGAAQAGQAAKQATAATLGQAGQQLYGMGTGAGQQLYGMGTGAGQQLSGISWSISRRPTTRCSSDGTTSSVTTNIASRRRKFSNANRRDEPR